MGLISTTIAIYNKKFLYILIVAAYLHDLKYVKILKWVQVNVNVYFCDSFLLKSSIKLLNPSTCIPWADVLC